MCLFFSLLFTGENGQKIMKHVYPFSKKEKKSKNQKLTSIFNVCFELKWANNPRTGKVEFSKIKGPLGS